MLFHQNLRDHLTRTMTKFSKVLDLISNELSYVRYASKKEEARLSLEDYLIAEQVLVSGELRI